MMGAKALGWKAVSLAQVCSGVAECLVASARPAVSLCSLSLVRWTAAVGVQAVVLMRLMSGRRWVHCG